MLDMVVERSQLKPTLVKCLRHLTGETPPAGD